MYFHLAAIIRFLGEYIQVIVAVNFKRVKLAGLNVKVVSVFEFTQKRVLYIRLNTELDKLHSAHEMQEPANSVMSSC